MSGVISITPEAFAKLVGRDDRDDYVFMVSEAVVRDIPDLGLLPEEICLTSVTINVGLRSKHSEVDWSEPVQFRFRREGGALVEMELRSVSADLTLRGLMGQTL